MTWSKGVWEVNKNDKYFSAEDTVLVMAHKKGLKKFGAKDFKGEGSLLPWGGHFASEKLTNLYRREILKREKAPKGNSYIYELNKEKVKFI